MDARREIMRAAVYELRVVGICEVLNVNLPVPWQRLLCALGRDTDKIAVGISGPKRFNLGEARRQCLRARIKIDEDEAVPELDLDRGKLHPAAEVTDLVERHARRANEIAFKVVSPEMKRTANVTLFGIRARQDLATMSAYRCHCVD